MRTMFLLAFSIVLTMFGLHLLVYVFDSIPWQEMDKVQKYWYMVMCANIGISFTLAIALGVIDHLLDETAKLKSKSKLSTIIS